MKIPLTRGKIALIDRKDYQKIKHHHWCAQKIGSTWYAGARERPFYLLMHRVILGAKKGQWVDHKNGDGLDNRRCNIRLCTPAQNLQYKRKRSDSKNRYKGITFRKSRNAWFARIRYNGKQKYIGQFPTQKQAALAYDEAAEIYHGEFALLNFGKNG